MHEDAPVVIVEDALSMHSIARTALYIEANPYVLYGSHMDITELLYLKNNGVSKVVVWLDNDNDCVLKNAKLIASRAKALGLECEVIHDQPEPKHHTLDGILNILRSVL